MYAGSAVLLMPTSGVIEARGRIDSRPRDQNDREGRSMVCLVPDPSDSMMYSELPTIALDRLKAANPGRRFTAGRFRSTGWAPAGPSPSPANGRQREDEIPH